VEVNMAPGELTVPVHLDCSHACIMRMLKVRDCIRK